MPTTFLRRRIHDPVFQASGFRCCYCDTDLLADLLTFTTAVRDHLLPRRKGGTNALANRKASCGCCDILKRCAGTRTVAEARALLARRRAEALAVFNSLRLHHDREALPEYARQAVAIVLSAKAGKAVQR